MAAVWQQNMSMIEFKKIFLFNQGVNNSQRAGNNCNYPGEGRQQLSVGGWRFRSCRKFPGLVRKEALYADVIVPLSMSS